MVDHGWNSIPARPRGQAVIQPRRSHRLKGPGFHNRITTMTLKETLKQFKAPGDAKVRAQNAKGGAGDNQFGVSPGDIWVLAKKVRTDHPSALALWKTVNVDAQFLATLLIQPPLP